MLKVAPDVAELLRGEVERLTWTPPWAWPNRLCKETLRAAPVWGDGVSLWALRPDGVLFRLDCDSADAADPETRPERVRDVLIRAAELLPGLKTVLADNFGAETPGLVRPVSEWIELLRRGEPLRLRAGRDRAVLEARAKDGGYVVTRDGRSVSPRDESELGFELREFRFGSPFEIVS